MSLDNQLQLVKDVKKALYGDENKILNDPKKAFQITKTVASILRNEGIGLVNKPGADNGEGYSTDKIMLPNGDMWDILGSSETDATPQWSKVPDTQPSNLWRIPIIVEDPRGKIPPIDGNDNTNGDNTKISDKLVEISNKLVELKKLVNEQNALLHEVVLALTE